jgi:hypothetical protein
MDIKKFEASLEDKSLEQQKELIQNYSDALVSKDIQDSIDIVASYLNQGTDEPTITAEVR